MESPVRPHHPTCTPSQRRRDLATSRRHQRGVGLLEAALVVLLIGSAIAVGFLVLQSRKSVQQVRAQEQALQWADQALVAYAAQHARLPCAVATPSSDAGDCVGPGQKGWLPVRALEGVHPGGGGAMPPLRYMVYRGDGGASDLAQAQDRFDPHKWDETPHDFDAVNGLDLCAALASAAAAGLKGDRARTTDIDDNTVNVAYGLGAAGATPGASGLFDASNQQPGALMESPARGADADYDDRVRVRDFDSLARTLGCQYAGARNPGGLVLASLDMLALAVDVSDEVDAQNAALIDETQGAVAMAAVSEAFAVLNVALAAASISNSATTLATASAQLASAVATCPVPPFVSCGLIAPYTAAVTSAAVAVGLNSAATALAATALAAASVGLGLTVEARDMAVEANGEPPVDLAGLAEKACIAAEGGWLTQDIDDSGELVTVPRYWKDGLKQEVEQLEQDLQQTIAERDAAEERLAWLGEIPSHLIDYPPEPTRRSWQHCVGEGAERTCHTDYESDASLNQRINEWLGKRADMEAVLQPKLEAIRIAEQAYFDWENAEQLVQHARTERDQMVDAIAQLSEEVRQCDASPPTELNEMRRCSNSRVALLGMTTCDLDILTAKQVEQRQCLEWKQEDLAEAEANEQQARDDYGQKFLDAWTRPQPPIEDYLDDGTLPGNHWLCSIAWSCDVLIVPGQHDDEDDKRETYAMTYYKLLGLREAVTKQTEELEEKRAAYEEAQAQCDALRGLQDQGAGGGTTVIIGAENILRYADCTGATGPVQPGTCPAGVAP
ncbi:MAG: hypothetical protein ACREPV_03505 [Lysobacter sp.]